MGGGGGEADDVARGEDGSEAADEVAEPGDAEVDEEWPGLESLPPGPPHAYPPARPFTRREPIEPAALPPPAPVPAADVPPSDPVRRERPTTLLAVLGALVVLLLVVTALFVRAATDDDEVAAAVTTTTTSTSAVPSSTTTTTAEPEDPSTSTTTSTLAPLEVPPDPPLEAAVAEATTFVAAQRGVERGDPISAVRLPDAEFEARVREQLQADEAALQDEANWLELTGLVPDSDAYLEQVLAEYPTLVGAYYDPQTKRITARGEAGADVDPALQVTLAHEVTHALDDRRFDVAALTASDPTTERAFGARALIEGDGMRMQRAYAEAKGLRTADVTSPFNDIVSTRFADTYSLGDALVTHIVARGGEAELDGSFADPPTTSEQVMHPQKYEVREPPVPLAPPPADGEVVLTGVVGEYTTRLMLASATDLVTATGAAAGWGNDVYVQWVQTTDQGTLTCMRIAYAMDTPTDLDVLEDAFARWIEAGPNRSGAREADRLVVTTCAEVPPSGGVSPL